MKFFSQFFENNFFKVYKNVWSSISVYWKTYGGFKDLIRSPYLHASILIAIICFPVHSSKESPWFSFPLSIVPNLLGFTLGGYAILLAFGNEKFLTLLSRKINIDSGNSSFMNINGAFAHFIVIQVISIIYALVCSVWEVRSGMFAFVGFTTFVYSLFSALAASFSILRLGRWYDIYLRKKHEIDGKKETLTTSDEQ